MLEKESRNFVKQTYSKNNYYTESNRERIKAIHSVQEDIADTSYKTSRLFNLTAGNRG